jgi:hypothetical protein
LPAYTYSVASAAITVTSGTIQLADISQLNRQITVAPNGAVTSSDDYNIINNSTSMICFIVAVPSAASNLVVKDQFGRVLTISTSTAKNVLLANATMITFLGSGQTTSITATYNLPSATIQGSQCTLNNFEIFPDFNYYVDQAVSTFTPPEGATITAPKLSSLDTSSTVTRNSFQDTLTVTRNGVSFVDYSVPQENIVQLSYSYNPVWVSFLPTFWVSLLAVVGCITAVFYRRRQPGEKEPITTKSEKYSSAKATSTTEQVKTLEPLPTHRITSESIREFADSYEKKKQLNSELRSLDARAQKGKIPRRQYKVQRKAIETRLETISRNTARLKDVFRSSGGDYAGLAKQLDSAEADLTEAEDNIRKLESQQSTGEISLETYKRKIGDYQKRRDKAESTMNGILLRLREKAR